MKIIGIIAEYNPMHQGHAYQIQAARQLTGSDSAVCVVMSGCFTQRGEPALTDKWSRTRMALGTGADLVLELPFAYACASAERFADGGVRTLQATGLKSTLVFGSESGDLTLLQQLADQLVPETPEYRQHLHRHLDSGVSFPAARRQALADLDGHDLRACLLDQPNNILAVEYLKAIRRLPDCRLTPLTIRRSGQGYHDDQLPDEPDICPSASAIRRAVYSRTRTCTPVDLAGLLQDLASAMPPGALAELMTRIQSGPGPLFADDLAVPILTLLRRAADQDLDQIAGMGEGLSRRLKACAARPGSLKAHRLEQLLLDSSTRRFTRTRIQRALIALLAGERQTDLDRFDCAGGPQYLRVLGFNRRGRYLLKLMRHLAERPIITRASDFLEYSDQPDLQRMAQLDLTAADIWQLAAGQSCGLDFDRPVIMR
jgi:predicted nucleotidyltransferase